MKTVIEEIDVDKARAYLEKNPTFQSGEKGTNRPISWVTVNNYARDMLNGRWLLTHQGIAFDTDGWLKDGQQRLLALVQAAEDGAIDGDNVIPAKPKIKVQFNVTYGVAPNTFDVMDVGRGRNSSQILAMAGHVNTTLLGAAGRLLYLFDNYPYEQWRKVKVTSDMVLDYVNKNKLANYLGTGPALAQVGFIASSAIVGHFVCQRAFPTGPHESFLDALKTGENLKSEDPRLALRNYMIRSKRAGAVTRRESPLHLALYIKGWNDFANKRRRSQVSWRTSESFPQPVDKVNGD